MPVDNPGSLIATPDDAHELAYEEGDAADWGTKPRTVGKALDALAAGGGLTSPVGIADGGTGQTTAQAAIDAISAVAAATNEHVLTKDTATGNAKFKAAAGGGGAPTTADYVVKTADAGLSAERVLTDVARGGIKNDWGTAGQLKLTATTQVFIVNATSGGTVTSKVYDSSTNPASKVLASFTSDNDSVTISVEVDAGPAGGVGHGWQPTVTIQGGTAPVVVTNLAPIATGSRRFTGSAAINATTTGTIYATVDDGGQSQDVAYTRAANPPSVLTAIFAAQASGIYPGVQTQFKSGDSVRITGTTQSHATRVFIKNAGISDSQQGPFTVTAGAFDFTATAGTRSSATQTGTLFADTGSGTTAGADFVTTNTADQDQTSPTFSAVGITYPATQEALKASETADVAITHTNIAAGDTYLYDTGPSPPTPDYLNAIPSSTTYAVTKTVTRNSAGPTYNEGTVDYRLTVTRTTKNGKAASTTGIVKIAAVTPVITITDNANAVLGRMGTDNGTSGFRDWTVKIRSNQANLSTYTASVSLTAPKGTWQGSWAASGSLDYTRALRVADADLLTGGQAANNYTWGACSVRNRAGMTATVVTTNTTYQLGGFQTRTLTQPAAPAHQIAIGCRAVNTAKLIAVNLSKGGSPTQAFEANVTEHNNANPALNDFFTISNGSDVYTADGTHYHNSDKLFSDSNTSGTAQISIQETA